MSEPKNFLARWSERKLKPEKNEETPDENKSAAEARGDDQPAPEAARTEPEFDITRLPSLESITGNSDVRAFLQRGVPSHLRHAALRRAWSADPAIRDFIGLSENSWDFNQPGSLPGFGPIDAEDVGKLAARYFGDALQEKPSDSPEGASDKQEIAGQPPAQTQVARLEQPSAVRQTQASDDAGVTEAASDGDAAVASAGQNDAAPQQEPSDAPADSPSAPRRHGSALPR